MRKSINARICRLPHIDAWTAAQNHTNFVRASSNIAKGVFSHDHTTHGWLAENTEKSDLLQCDEKLH